MGNGMCGHVDEENARINKATRREEKKWREQYRLLLLGTFFFRWERCVGVWHYSSISTLHIHRVLLFFCVLHCIDLGYKFASEIWAISGSTSARAQLPRTNTLSIFLLTYRGALSWIQALERVVSLLFSNRWRFCRYVKVGAAEMSIFVV